MRGSWMSRVASLFAVLVIAAGCQPADVPVSESTTTDTQPVLSAAEPVAGDSAEPAKESATASEPAPTAETTDPAEPEVALLGSPELTAGIPNNVTTSAAPSISLTTCPPTSGPLRN